MIKQILIENRGFLIALCIALISAYIAIYIHNRNRFHAASDKFRSIVLVELKGLFPVNGFWKPEVYPKIQGTMPTIKKAALEFRATIPFYRKSRFDKTVIAYCEHCQNIKWDKAVMDAVFSDDIKQTQKEQFVKCVDHLLSFTE